MAFAPVYHPSKNVVFSFLILLKKTTIFPKLFIHNTYYKTFRHPNLFPVEMPYNSGILC